MAIVCFASYEIHPTTPGGCGVLLHHAATALLRDGHTVVLLLDIPEAYFDAFRDRDRLALPHADRCRAHHVDALCADFPFTPEQIVSTPIWRSLRFAHALERILPVEDPDFVEFFDYCGTARHALVQRLYAEEPGRGVIGIRLHGSMELIDRHGGTRDVGRDRHLLYAFERGAFDLAEVVLAPSRRYVDAYLTPNRIRIDDKVIVSAPPTPGLPPVRRRIGAGEPFSIVNVGRLVPCKGVDQLVGAAVLLMERHPDVPCTIEIVGPDGSDSPVAESYAAYLDTIIPAELRSRFVLRGQLSHEEIARTLERALFAVFPNRFESFCYALHEVYDAAVPIVVNDVPGMADPFTHERNALVYDGTTGGLLAAMERLVDDAALRERLRRPYPVASPTLDGFYAAPRALAPLHPPVTRRMRALVVVLGGPAEAVAQTGEALAQQTTRAFDVVHLVPAGDGAGGALWWLGQPWFAQDAGGAAMSHADLRSRDAIAILAAGDRPAPAWLACALRALERRDTLGFAGSWIAHAGLPVPSTLDVAPELYPFEHGAAPTRTVVPTDRGQLLVDLLDPTLAELGEVGLLWRSVATRGPGALLPRVLVDVASVPVRRVDRRLLVLLVHRYGSPFAAALALLAASQASPPSHLLPGWLRAPMLSQEDAIAAARELDGRTLLRLAREKLQAKVVRTFR